MRLACCDPRGTSPRPGRLVPDGHAGRSPRARRLVRAGGFRPGSRAVAVGGAVGEHADPGVVAPGGRVGAARDREGAGPAGGDRRRALGTGGAVDAGAVHEDRDTGRTAGMATWRARLQDTVVAAAFAPGAKPCRVPDAGRSEVARMATCPTGAAAAAGLLGVSLLYGTGRSRAAAARTAANTAAAVAVNDCFHILIPSFPGGRHGPVWCSSFPHQRLEVVKRGLHPARDAVVVAPLVRVGHALDTLAYTGARVGAVTNIRLRNLRDRRPWGGRRLVITDVLAVTAREAGAACGPRPPVASHAPLAVRGDPQHSAQRLSLHVSRAGQSCCCCTPARSATRT